MGLVAIKLLRFQLRKTPGKIIGKYYLKNLAV